LPGSPPPVDPASQGPSLLSPASPGSSQSPPYTKFWLLPLREALKLREERGELTPEAFAARRRELEAGCLDCRGAEDHRPGQRAAGQAAEEAEEEPVHLPGAGGGRGDEQSSGAGTAAGGSGAQDGGR